MPIVLQKIGWTPPNVSDVDALTEKIIGCAISVYRTLGPGLLESIYRHCMVIEIRARGLRVETERRISLTYRGQRVPIKFQT